MQITGGDYRRVPESHAGGIDIQIVTHNGPVQAVGNKVERPAALVKQRGIPGTLNGSIGVGRHKISVLVDHQDGTRGSGGESTVSGREISDQDKSALQDV